MPVTSITAHVADTPIAVEWTELHIEYEACEHILDQRRYCDNYDLAHAAAMTWLRTTTSHYGRYESHHSVGWLDDGTEVFVILTTVEGFYVRIPGTARSTLDEWLGEWSVKKWMQESDDPAADEDAIRVRVALGDRWTPS